MFEGNCKLINFNMKLVVNNTIVVIRIALIKIYLVFNVIVHPQEQYNQMEAYALMLYSIMSTLQNQKSQYDVSQYFCKFLLFPFYWI